MAKCTILRKEYYEDEEYNIDVVYLSNGGRVVNKHPKHPLVDKEEVLERVGQMFLEAWRKVQARQENNI